MEANHERNNTFSIHPGYLTSFFYSVVLLADTLRLLSCFISSRASRDEERWEEEARIKKETAKMNKIDKLTFIIKGKPDRE